jgi:hypothetical protein
LPILLHSTLWRPGKPCQQIIPIFDFDFRRKPDAKHKFQLLKFSLPPNFALSIFPLFRRACRRVNGFLDAVDCFIQAIHRTLHFLACFSESAPKTGSCSQRCFYAVEREHQYQIFQG